MAKKLEKFAVKQGSERYEDLIKRQIERKKHSTEMRSEFMHDYNKILHSLAFRRLKHKTQVFFNPQNDHICTRMEHVQHVEAVSYTIADSLGLNTELTRAIALGHDVGHAPFGHLGEQILSKIALDKLKIEFWHESNGLRFVDKIEYLEDSNGKKQNLNLTYAVRDGIISHCGEVDKNGIKPRNELFDLDNFCNAGQYEPCTFEGAVVKLSDKIAYLGRDIQDALMLGVIDEKQLNNLYDMIGKKVNTSSIMHDMIADVCKNSSYEHGIILSDEKSDILNKIKDFNSSFIYKSERLKEYAEYAKFIISRVFNFLCSYYDGVNTIKRLKKDQKCFDYLIADFIDFISKRMFGAKNALIKPYQDLSSETLYYQAVLDYISGMTDGYIVKIFNELITI